MRQETWKLKCFSVLCFMMLLFGGGTSMASPQEIEQSIQVSGVVTDANGELLPGVNVFVKGTTQGVITDLDGKFTLYVPSRKSVLVVSFVGYQTSETIVGNTRNFKIVLEEEVNSLDEVVVVAYGSQKKQTVTGAITVLKTDELLEAPVANVTNALTGKLPGVITHQKSGRPGEDAADIYIRGVGTWNNAKPLIIIDGIEQESFSQIDPNEIQSLSVLKDASSTAVYGIRGANGVILITTKRGASGKPKISLTANWGMQVPTAIPEKLESYDQLLFERQGYLNDGKDPLKEAAQYFTPEALEGFRKAQYGIPFDDPLDFYRYPNINWYDEFVKKSGSLQQQYNVNVSGGTQVVKYFISVGFVHQDGLLKHHDLQKEYDPSVWYRRFNFRSNIDLKINKYQTLTANISGRQEVLNGMNAWHQLHTGGGTGVGSFFQSLINASPYGHPMYNPDGSIATPLVGGNPINTIAYAGYVNQKKNYYDLIGTLKNDLSFITKGLSFDMSISFNNSYGNMKKYVDGMDQYYWDPISGDYTQTYEKKSFGFGGDTSTSPMRRTNLQLKLAYTRKFNLHNLNALVVYNQQKTNNGAAIPSALMGYAARVEYGFADKYLLEASLGYNGSENFAKGHRFGLFPSGSIGYVISEEPFMRNVKKFIPYLKLRGSVGLVGNDRGQGRFLYMAEYSTANSSNTGADSFLFGTTNPTSSGGIAEKRAGNKELTWETALKSNVGIELKLFKKDLLSVSFDYFREHRKDILMQLNSIPTIVGVASPWANVGETKNWGYEIDLTHRHKIGEVSYFVKGNYSFSRNKVIYKDDPVNKPAYQKQAGYRIGQQRGYEVIGFFQDEEDVKNSPSQLGLGGPIVPGDLKYKDINEDGVITKEDMTPIGYARIPEIMYSFTPGLMWKGLEVSVMFQGAAHSTVFYNGGVKQKQNYWTPENQHPESPVPHRVSHSNSSPNSFFQRNGGYLRLKTATISYSFPSNLCKKMHMSSLKVYLSGNNLVTWSHIDNFDPEVVRSDGDVYPQQSVYNLGVNINF